MHGDTIGLYRDVWIAAIASSRKSLATRTAAICVRLHGRRVRHVYVTMQITFLARKSALIYRRQRVASLTIDCNGVFAIRAYRYESPEGSCEIRDSKFAIRNSGYEIRDTASLANHVHAHYDVPRTKYGGCCGGDVTGLRLIRHSICLHCWAAVDILGGQKSNVRQMS